MTILPIINPYIAVKKTYIIGGLTDRKYTKGKQTAMLAKKLGIPAFRLPLDSFFKNTLYGQRKILNVDTCVQALSMYLDTKHWDRTFDIVLPAKYQVMKYEKPLFNG